jgi:hypothetical protein
MGVQIVGFVEWLREWLITLEATAKEKLISDLAKKLIEGYKIPCKYENEANEVYAPRALQSCVDHVAGGLDRALPFSVWLLTNTRAAALLVCKDKVALDIADPGPPTCTK